MKSRIFFAPFLPLLLFAFLFASCKQTPEETDNFTHIDPTTLQRGDTIAPFRFINPKEAEWKVEVRISGDDLHDVSHNITSRKFTAVDPELLQRIRKLKFIYGVGKIHKPTSTLRVYKDVKLFEQHGVVFEKKYLALQSKIYGIMTCADQEEFFAIMEEMY